jgi:tetratricopeptide (TPR) repeat protein
LSFTELKLGMVPQAEQANLNSLAIRRELYGEQHPSYAGSLTGRASVLLAKNLPAQALTSVDRALAIFVQAGQQQSQGVAPMHKTRAAALLALGRHAEALADLDVADNIVKKVAPDDALFALGSTALRAEILYALHRLGEARAAAVAVLKMPSHREFIGNERWLKLEDIANAQRN